MGAAEAARRISAKELDELTALQAEFISMTSTNPTRASYLNRKFHFAILEASRMPTLISTVETFWVITGPILKIIHVKTSGQDYSDRHHKNEPVPNTHKTT